jgi:hypothetical protein
MIAYCERCYHRTEHREGRCTECFPVPEPVVRDPDTMDLFGDDFPQEAA